MAWVHPPSADPLDCCCCDAPPSAVSVVLPPSPLADSAVAVAVRVLLVVVVVVVELEVVGDVAIVADGATVVAAA